MEITLQSKQRVLAAALVFGAVYVLMFSMGISKTHADTGYGNSAYTNSPPVSQNNCWDDNQMRAKWDTDWNSYLSQKQNNEDWKTYYNRMGWQDMVSWHDRQTNCDDNWNWKSGTQPTQNQSYNHDQYQNNDQDRNCDHDYLKKDTDNSWDGTSYSKDGWDKNSSSHDSWSDNNRNNDDKGNKWSDNNDKSYSYNNEDD